MHRELGPAVKPNQIRFHHLQLDSMAPAYESAEAFAKKESHLDVLILNAGISVPASNALNADGFEPQFGTNHLAHFAFTMGILPLLRKTASSSPTADPRIVVVSSWGSTFPRHALDYTLLKTPPSAANARSRTGDFPRAFSRYCDSKLANVLFALDLDRRLQGGPHPCPAIRVNVCHPGSSLATGLGGDSILPLWAEKGVRMICAKLTNTAEDSARTQVVLAAAGRVRDRDLRGVFSTPEWSWLGYWRECYQVPSTKLQGDVQAQKQLWALSEECLKKATGKEAGV